MSILHNLIKLIYKMDKIDKDTFLTDTGLKNTLQRAMTARFSNKNIGAKLDTKIETEEEIINKQSVKNKC